MGSFTANFHEEKLILFYVFILIDKFVCVCISVLGIESRASHMLG